MWGWISIGWFAGWLAFVVVCVRDHAQEKRRSTLQVTKLVFPGLVFWWLYLVARARYGPIESDDDWSEQ